MKARVKDKPRTRRPRGIVLAADGCPNCGTMMRRSRHVLKLPVNGELTSVSGQIHLRCPRCDEAVLTAPEAVRLAERAMALYRDKYGLLPAEDIRDIRQHFGLTQAALARLLRLGANTLSRWESGRNVQTAAMDVLLRLIRDVPGSIEYLRRSAA